MRIRLCLSVVVALSVVLPAAGAGADGREAVMIVGESLHAWTFDAGVEGWQGLHHCTVSAAGGVMKIVSTDHDPYLSAVCRAAGPDVLIKIRAKSSAAGKGQFFWATDKAGGFAEERSKHFDMIHDGKWHDYTLPIRVTGTMTAMRLDPGTAAGTIEIDSIAIHRGGPHPLSIERLETGRDSVVVHVKNISGRPITFEHSDETYTVGGDKTKAIIQMLRGGSQFERCIVTLTSPGLPALKRSMVVFRSDAKEGSKCTTIGGGDLKVRIFYDGVGARIEHKGKLVAVLGPISRVRYHLQPFVVRQETPDSALLGCVGITCRLAVKGDEISVEIDASKRTADTEGPVLRVLGSLEGGLFAGLEYLGKGEKSSSKLDIETDDHMRIAPDPMLVTMPLMACVTDRGTVAMTWNDMSLRPVYASPNVLDGATDHRMALRGKKIVATILIKDKATVEDTIAWAVKKAGGLPDLPKAPRDGKAQLALAMKSINGPISGEGGWGHCAEAKWKRQYFADVASTIWRITGRVPKTGPLAPGGAHVPNDAIFFAAGQAQRWLAIRGGEAKRIIASQQADGSFRYAGKYRKGHFEDTSSGHCARPAASLLQWARYTGDAAALRAGVKALDYMKRFRTPRGAQTWELSLHTPDVLASAYLVQAYVLGYELTGKKAYLAEARRWALSGVPFVYLWSKHPTMLYATPPVYGATSYRAPLWIGLPVQWCGGVYAYALTGLAKHDKTLDWTRLARGIYIAAQQIQYPDGPLAGCLPDIYVLPSQQRAGPSINPCAIASLQWALEGKVDSLAVASDGKHRIVAPFAVTIKDGLARIEGKKGQTYQVVIDGSRVITVTSRGIDEVPLAKGK